MMHIDDSQIYKGMNFLFLDFSYKVEPAARLASCIVAAMHDRRLEAQASEVPWVCLRAHGSLCILHVLHCILLVQHRLHEGLRNHMLP
ncbi:hypothetical protein ACJX0J_019904, partial [Zea mays]